MICSMSRKGNCWDNAPTESFFNSFKNERVHGTRYETRAEAIADAFDYIEPFYNRRRRHSTLGYASPQEFLDELDQAVSMSRNWRHNAVGLEDEKPREAQAKRDITEYIEIFYHRIRNQTPLIYLPPGTFKQ